MLVVRTEETAWRLMNWPGCVALVRICISVLHRIITLETERSVAPRRQHCAWEKKMGQRSSCTAICIARQSRTRAWFLQQRAQKSDFIVLHYVTKTETVVKLVVKCVHTKHHSWVSLSQELQSETLFSKIVLLFPWSIIHFTTCTLVWQFAITAVPHLNISGLRCVYFNLMLAYIAGQENYSVTILTRRFYNKH